MKKIRAFTLAETLTTLLIIGVISAVLIPVTYVNVSKQKTISAFKRLYSSFSVNVKTVLGEANCSTISCLRAYKENTGANPTKHNGVFANPKYINIQASCPTCVEDTAILPIGSRDDYSIYRLSNSSYMLLYDFADGNCIDKTHVQVGSDNVDACGVVVFDVNGQQAPNMPGKDRFAYYIVDEALAGSYLVPFGYSDDLSEVISTKIDDGKCEPESPVGKGYNCTAKIMLNKWKMDY